MIEMKVTECENHFNGEPGKRCEFDDLRWLEFLEVMKFVNEISEHTDNGDVIWEVFGQFGGQDYFGDPTRSEGILLKVDICQRDDLVAAMEMRFAEPEDADNG